MWGIGDSRLYAGPVEVLRSSRVSGALRLRLCLVLGGAGFLITALFLVVPCFFPSAMDQNARRTDATTPPAKVWLSKDELAKRRAQLWWHLNSASGKPPDPARISCMTIKTRYECQAQYEVLAQNRVALHGVLRDHLAFADAALRQATDPARRRLGLGIARQAVYCCMAKLKDLLLASAVADVLLLPNIDAADPRRWADLSRDDVLGTAEYVFRESNTVDKWERVCRWRLEEATLRNDADAARYDLACFLEQQKRYDEAVVQLLAVTTKDRSRAIHEMVRRIQLKIANRELLPSDKSKKAQP